MREKFTETEVRLLIYGYLLLLPVIIWGIVVLYCSDLAVSLGG